MVRHPAASGDRVRDAEGRPFSPTESRPDPPSPRAMGRGRLSGQVEGRLDLAAGANRHRRRCLRCYDVRPPLSKEFFFRVRCARHRERIWSPVRPGGSGRFHRQKGRDHRPTGRDGQEAGSACLGYSAGSGRMSRTLRWTQWTVVATAVLLLFWVAATLGGWSPDLRRLTTNVHGPLVADYRAESPQLLAPLSPDITQDASRDQAGSPRPSASPSTGPSPSASAASPTPPGSGTIPPTPSLPTLPVPTPSLPVPTPSLPVPTPTLPIATPTLVPTPSLPTLPPLPWDGAAAAADRRPTRPTAPA